MTATAFWNRCCKDTRREKNDDLMLIHFDDDFHLPSDEEQPNK